MTPRYSVLPSSYSTRIADVLVASLIVCTCNAVRPSALKVAPNQMKNDYAALLAELDDLPSIKMQRANQRFPFESRVSRM